MSRKFCLDEYFTESEILRVINVLSSLHSREEGEGRIYSSLSSFGKVSEECSPSDRAPQGGSIFPLKNEIITHIINHSSFPEDVNLKKGDFVCIFSDVERFTCDPHGSGVIIGDVSFFRKKKRRN